MLSQIESDALDAQADLAGALRKCVALGGQSRSEALRAWASRELKGYEREEDIPPYRELLSEIAIDGIAGNYRITGEAISTIQLPEPANKEITARFKLGNALAELTYAASQAEKSGDGSVSFGLPMGQELVMIMNHERQGQWQHVERVYRRVALSSLNRVLDGVRTTLVELVAEMRAGMDDRENDAEPLVPSERVADQAVQIAVYGNKARIELGQVGPTSAGRDVKSTHKPASEGRARTIMYWVGGIAGLVLTVGGLIAWVM